MFRTCGVQKTGPLRLLTLSSVISRVSTRRAGQAAQLSWWPAPVRIGDGISSTLSVDFVLQGDVRVASPVIVRVAGLPVTALARLRCDETFANVLDVIELRERLMAEGEELSEELHTVIGALEKGSGEKPTLVGLRRAVFRVRMPTEREWNDRVVAALPDGLADRLRQWMSALGEHERLSAQIPATLDSEARSAQGVLRDLVSHPGFRRALWHASPTLFAETAKWLAEETRRPQRQSLVRLAKYVARAAAKTSPFSMFTISGTADWSEEEAGARFIGPTRIEGVLELNSALTRRLIAVLCEDPRLSAGLRLRANPSATVHEGTVRFLGPPLQESILRVPAIPAILECLRILDSGACHTSTELRNLLRDGDSDDASVESFLKVLTETGLLERRLPVADLATDPLGELARWLGSYGSEGFADIVAMVNQVRSKLRDPAPPDDPEGHVARQRELGVQITELAERVGLPGGFTTDHKDLIHENAVFAGPVAELSMPRWRPALEDLDVLRRAIAVADPALPLRVVLGVYCAERFGPGSRVPFLLLHEAIAEDLSRDERDQDPVVREIAGFLRLTSVISGPILAGSGLARLRELDRIQREVRRVMRSRTAADGVVRIDPGVLARMSAAWPEWITIPESVTGYVQVVGEADSPRLVVNTLHGGYGRGRSRALHLVRQADETVPHDRAWDAAGGTPALAEFGGLFGFSPNMRLPSVPYEIDYPFTVSDRPLDRRIPLNDLEVVHDTGTELVSLVSRSLKSEVKALHLGMMADVLLPPAARLMSKAFGCGYLGLQAFTSVEPALPAPGSVLAVARVELGRVVVRRARWIAAAESVPARGKGESDAAFLLRIVAWLREHGIPTRCFVRVSAADVPAPGQRRRAPEEVIFDRSRKPVFVDFASWYLVMVFERMLPGQGSAVVFEEALPAPEDALDSDFADPGVTEFVVEISGADRGR